MNEIIRILMKRDGLTKTEVKNLIKETVKMMEDAIANGAYWEAGEIFESELGLEPDYIFYVL